MAKVAETKIETKDVVIIGGLALLAGTGIYLLTRKVGVKKPGDTVTAKITVAGRGYPGNFQVGFGLSQAGITRQRIRQFIKEIVPMELTPEWQNFTFTIKGKLDDVFEPGKLDAYIFVDKEDYLIDPDNAQPSPIGDSRWYDDVFTVA